MNLFERLDELERDKTLVSYHKVSPAGNRVSLVITFPGETLPSIKATGNPESLLDLVDYEYQKYKARKDEKIITEILQRSIDLNSRLRYVKVSFDYGNDTVEITLSRQDQEKTRVYYGYASCAIDREDQKLESLLQFLKSLDVEKLNSNSQMIVV